MAACLLGELCLVFCDLIGVLEFDDVNHTPLERIHRNDALGSGYYG